MVNDRRNLSKWPDEVKELFIVWSSLSIRSRNNWIIGFVTLFGGHYVLFHILDVCIFVTLYFEKSKVKINTLGEWITYYTCQKSFDNLVNEITIKTVLFHFILTFLLNLILDLAININIYLTNNCTNQNCIVHYRNIINRFNLHLFSDVHWAKFRKWIIGKKTGTSLATRLGS